MKTPLTKKAVKHLISDPFLTERGIPISAYKQKQNVQSGRYNRFVNYFGLDSTVAVVCESILRIRRRFPAIDKIISVGSGTGYLERRIDERVSPTLRMICIDPSPTQFINATVQRQPDFPTVDAFLKTDPDSPWNSILLLNWPDNRPDHGAGYDVDAIRKLNPLSIIIIYALNDIDFGNAGSRDLHRMRDSDTLYKKESVVVFTHFDQQVYWKVIHKLLASGLSLELAGKSANDIAKQTFTIEIWIREAVQHVASRTQLQNSKLRLLSQSTGIR